MGKSIENSPQFKDLIYDIEALLDPNKNIGKVVSRVNKDGSMAEVRVIPRVIRKYIEKQTRTPKI